ncbi:MAG: tRNA pseudouridine(38-40) synthase TruA [Candidatus Hodarchaeales archaeon]
MHITICFGYLPSLEYSGFSKQLHDSNNIYTIIIRAIKNARLMNDNIDPKLRFASRTDRGVGAINQVVSLISQHAPVIAEINSHLPESIRALGFTEVSPNFHPRKDALLRTYSYFLSINQKLDLDKMKRTLHYLIGTHDFQNFAKRDPKKEKKTIKTIEKADIYALNDYTYQIRISSKSFLWQQVRRIVGHLVEISNGKCNELYTRSLLENDSVSFKPSPVPPQYLILEKIDFENVQFEYDQKSITIFRSKLIEALSHARSNSGLFSFLVNYFSDLKKSK